MPGLARSGCAGGAGAPDRDQDIAAGRPLAPKVIDDWMVAKPAGVPEDAVAPRDAVPGQHVGEPVRLLA
jgi:hypothetical protein